MKLRLVVFFVPALLLAQSLSRQESAVVRSIDDEAPAAVGLLERLVNINSGTFNRTGVVAVGSVLESEFQSLGFTTRTIPMDAVNRAPSLVAQRKGTQGKRVLLIGHMDTVFEPASPFQKFVRDGNRATGPGTVDMKGGVVVILSALKALQKAGALDSASVTVFLTGDEENVAPPLSISRRDLIDAAKNSDVALSFEADERLQGKDTASTSRRSASTWELRVQSASGHSAGIFSEGVGDGAIYELTRILSVFHDTLREPNLTYNVGMVLGGSNIKANGAGEASVTGKANIIPGEALAVGDIRALTAGQLAGIKDRMQTILTKNLAGTKAQITFEDKYPPMPPTAGNIALLAKLNDANRALGVPAVEALDPMLRGAGDASFVAPYVDTLDGLGAAGAGAHAPGESVDLASLPLQSKRAALLIYRLVQ